RERHRREPRLHALRFAGARAQLLAGRARDGRGARGPRGDAGLARVRVGAAGQAVRVGGTHRLRRPPLAESRRFPHSGGPQKARISPISSPMNTAMNSLRFQLPPEGVLKPNDDHDPLPYYYNRWVGWLYRHRLQMGLDLLPAGGARVLEGGVGSGGLVQRRPARCSENTGTDLTLAPGLDALVAPHCAAKFLRADLLQDDLPESH